MCAALCEVEADSGVGLRALVRAAGGTVNSPVSIQSTESAQLHTHHRVTAAAATLAATH